MKMKIFVVASASIALSQTALAAEYLSDITSEVYQTPGSPRDITKRAVTCITQNLAPGSNDAQLIISSDPDSGVTVARNAIQYTDGLIQWQVRSTFTLEAREGRFRIVQTRLERFNRQWGPIGKWTGSGWKKAQDVFAASAAAVAKCLTAGQQSEEW